MHTYTYRRFFLHPLAVTEHYTTVDTNAIADAGRNAHSDTDRDVHRYPD
jgi:hypothetical protein